MPEMPEVESLARFLTENYPQRDPAATIVKEATDPPADTTPAEEATLTLSERLRGYVPRWWR